MALKKEEKIGVFLAVVLAFAFLGLSFVFFGHSGGIANPLDTDILDNNSNSDMENIEGLNISIVREGQGNEAKAGDTVSVHYIGTLENGTQFDSSIDRGQPFQFILGSGQVIPGWDLGLIGMKVGEVRRLEIAPELAYGEQEVGPIPANSTLIFEVELLEIQ